MVDGGPENPDVAADRSSGNDVVAAKSDVDGGKPTSSGGGGGGGGGSGKPKKAARWKLRRPDNRGGGSGGGWKAAKGEGEGGGRGGGRAKVDRRKRAYDEAGADVPPNEGSFASESMRRLFDVDIAGYPPPSPSIADGGGGGGGAKEHDGGDDDRDDEGGGDGGDSGNIVARKSGEGGEEAARVPKRKLAMLVSFLGTEYSGFQINARARTLQSELELGLYRAGIISARNFGHPAKYSWSNSARTDRGVHAAAQVCSFKGEMVCRDDDGGDGTGTGGDGDGDGGSNANLRRQFDAMRERVNRHLPDDVRVLDFERVTRGFCARTNRDRVRYQYMIPSYMLCTREEVRRAFSRPPAARGGGGGDGDGGADADAGAAAPDDGEAMERARGALARARVTPERMELLRSALRLFEGTHNFHNYTRRVGADDATSNRYILSFVPLDPVIVPSAGGGGGGGGGEDGPGDDTQWIPLQVVGQSFLLNQIRKMVSAAVDVARGAVPGEVIERSLTGRSRAKVDVAPANGLFLDRSYFELYNRHKVGGARGRGDKAEHSTLDWAEAEGEEMPPAGKEESFFFFAPPPHLVHARPPGAPRTY